MSNDAGLTLDKLMRTMDDMRKMLNESVSLPKSMMSESIFGFCERSPLLRQRSYRDEIAGLKVIEAPPPPPKLQCADIKFDDGTSILPPGFRASVNSWLIERFGYCEDPFRDSAYIFGGHSIIMSKPNLYAVLNRIGP